MAPGVLPPSSVPPAGLPNFERSCWANSLLQFLRVDPDFVLSVRELARARTDALETASDGPMAGLEGMRMVIDGDPAGVVPFRRFLSGAMAATGGGRDADPIDALDALVREFPELAIPVERHYVSTSEARACLPCIEARNPELAAKLRRRQEGFGGCVDGQVQFFEGYHHPLVAHSTQVLADPPECTHQRCCFREGLAHVETKLARGTSPIIVCLGRAPGFIGDRFKTVPLPCLTPIAVAPTLDGGGEDALRAPLAQPAHLVSLLLYHPTRSHYTCVVRSGDRWFRVDDSNVEEVTQPLSCHSMDVLRLYSRKPAGELFHLDRPFAPTLAPPCPSPTRSLAPSKDQNSVALDYEQEGLQEAGDESVWTRGLSATLTDIIGKTVRPLSSIDELPIGAILHHFLVTVEGQDMETEVHGIVALMRESLSTIGVVEGEVHEDGVGVVVAVVAARLGGTSGWSALRFDRHGASPAMQGSSQEKEHAGKVTHVRLEVHPTGYGVAGPNSVQAATRPSPLSRAQRTTLDRELYALRETRGLDPSRARSAFALWHGTPDVDRYSLRVQYLLFASGRLDPLTRALLEQPHSEDVNAQEAYCRGFKSNGAKGSIWLYGLRGSMIDEPTVLVLDGIGPVLLLHCRVAQHRAHHVVLPVASASCDPPSAALIARLVREAIRGLGYVATFDRVDEPLLVESAPPLLHRLNGRPNLYVIDRHVAPVVERAVRRQARGKKLEFSFGPSSTAGTDGRSAAPPQNILFWARLSDEDAKTADCRESILKQVLEMIEASTEFGGPVFPGLLNIDIVFEFASSFRHPLATRKAYRHVLDIIGSRPTTILMANLDRLSRRAREVETALDKFEELGAHFAVPTCSLLPENPVAGADVAASDPSSSSLGSSTNSTWTWFDRGSFATHGRRQLEHSLALSAEHGFYSSSTVVVDNALATANVALAAGRHHQIIELRSAITDYAARHGLDKVVTFARSSTNHLSEGSQLRQKAFLGLLKPPALAGTHIELAESAEDAVLQRELRSRGISQALVLVVSVDRAVRHPEHYDALARMAEEQGLHVVAMVWPADCASELAGQMATAQGSTGLLYPLATRAWFGGLLPRLEAGLSRPLILPAVLISPTLTPSPMLQRRVQAGKCFTQGFNASSHRLESNKVVPERLVGASLSSGESTAEWIKTIRGWLLRQLECTTLVLTCFEGLGSYICACSASPALTSHPSECTCGCPFCAGLRAATCSYHTAGDPEERRCLDWCTCTCSDHPSHLEQAGYARTSKERTYQRRKSPPTDPTASVVVGTCAVCLGPVRVDPPKKVSRKVIYCTEQCRKNASNKRQAGMCRKRVDGQECGKIAAWNGVPDFCSEHQDLSDIDLAQRPDLDRCGFVRLESAPRGNAKKKTGPCTKVKKKTLRNCEACRRWISRDAK